LIEIRRFDVIRKGEGGVMMRYKRDEAFRFEFGVPLPIVFHIDEINGSATNSSDGKAKMLDLSLKGMKIATFLSLPVDSQHEVKVTVHFVLNDRDYTVQGQLIWKKQRFKEYYYGMKFEVGPELIDALLSDLKIIGKRLAQLNP
jgi:PilZ domain